MYIVLPMKCAGRLLVCVCSNAEVVVAGCWSCLLVVSDVDADQAHSAQVLARHQTAQVGAEFTGRQLRVTFLLDSTGSSRDARQVLLRY